MTEDDRQMLQGILGYCLARRQALPTAWPMAPEDRARKRAYEMVARAACELLEEMDA